MDRVTLRLPTEQVAALDRLAERGAYPTRSEAIRAAVRELLDEDDLEVDPWTNV